MNRYLGLSGVVHVGLVAGLFYLGAKNDFSPHKLIESFTIQGSAGETLSESAPVAETAEISGQGQITETAKTSVTTALPAKSKNTKSNPQTAPKRAALAPKTETVSAAKSEQIDDSFVDEALSEVQVEKKVEPVVPAEVKTEEAEKTAPIAEANLTKAEDAKHEVVEQTNEESSDPNEQSEQEVLAQKKALLEDLRRQNAEREASEAAALSSNAAASGSSPSATSHGPSEGETVHALADFKQVAGNPKPQYDKEDRLKNRAGTVTFQAQVKKDGTLADFHMLESSGHRTLDAKTLKALKQWKFAAGQEGWIEIPFRWDLKGGAQELPSLRSSMKD